MRSAQYKLRNAHAYVSVTMHLTNSLLDNRTQTGFVSRQNLGPQPWGSGSHCDNLVPSLLVYSGPCGLDPETWE